MRAALGRLGHPDAINWATVAFVVIVQIAGSLMVAQVDYSGRLLEFLGVRVLAFVPLLGALALGRFALSRWPSPILTVGSWLASILLGTWAFDALLVATGFSAQSAFWSRLSVSWLTLLAGMLLCALVVTNARAVARNTAALQARAAELLELRSEAADRIEQRRRQLEQRLHAEVDTALERIDRSSSAAATLSLQQLLDGVVRPLSHQLLGDAPPVSERIDEVPADRISWRAVVREMLEHTSFAPLISGLWLTVLVGVFLGRTAGVAGWLAALATGAISMALSWVSLRCWPSSTRFGLLPRAVSFTIVQCVIAAASAVAVQLLTGFNMQVSTRILPWMAIVVLLAWIVGLMRAASRLAREAQRQVAALTDELKREVIALGAQLRALQRRAAHILHGPIQRAIAASIVRAQSEPAAIADRVLEDLQAQIASAFSQLAVDEPPVDLGQLFTELAVLWSDIISVDITVDPAAADRLRADSAASEALAEIVPEALTNAVRHGQARTFSVEVSLLPQARAVRALISNDGVALTDSPESGLGSRLLDEHCVSWTRRQAGRFVHIDAVIPLA